MQVLVISDTHGERDSIKRLLDKYAGQVAAVFHLGDHDRDLLKWQSETNLPLTAVAGNCDAGIITPRERIVELGGRRILLTHGNMLGVGAGYERLVYYAQEKKADVCLFGHTHVSAVFTEGEIFFMNPGSLSRPRDDNPPAYGLLTICEETGKVSGEIIFL